MSQSEVFVPSSGELLVRSPVNQGPTLPTDTFRKPRPATQGGYRFGRLSHNSFFTRHNPHPIRVRHLKGLLDVPICSVNDDGYFANPRYSLQFPPNGFNQTKLSNYKQRIPVNAINVNSQLHPINTITGLQYFTGLNSYPFREKAIPKVGMVPVNEAWRDELKNLTTQISQFQDEAQCLQAGKDRKEDERPRTTQYSPETGRLIPPPSRAYSRQASRRAVRQPAFQGNFQHIAAEPDIENIVMTMLCQILQTEDINAVQSWLVSAGEREKAIVTDLIKSALSGRDDYFQQNLPEFVEPEEPRTKLPPINGNKDAEPDRLVLDDAGMPQDRRWSKAWVPKPLEGDVPATPAPAPMAQPNAYKPLTPLKPIVETNGKDFAINPPTNEVFQPKSPRAERPPSPPKEMKPPGTAEARLRYTKSPTKDIGVKEPASMWSQNKSLTNTF